MQRTKEKDISTNNQLTLKAQATLEFVFAFIVLVLIFYGIVRAMQWVGVVLGSSENQHYSILHAGCTNTSSLSNTNYPDMKTFNPLSQLGESDKASLPKLQMTYGGQLINP